MRVAVISAWHNEAALAPFFLSHYRWADRLHLIIGDDTKDASLQIVEGAKNVLVEKHNFPGGLLNDTLKIAKFNKLAAQYRGGPYDWIVAVDADEFVFTSKFEDPRRQLEEERADVVWVSMWQMYRHRTEGPLDPSRPVVEQRRHGTMKVHHRKPIVVRAKYGVVWETGHHTYEKKAGTIESGKQLYGAHWAFADASIAVDRYVHGRKERMSQENLQKRHGFHTFELTAEGIYDKCASHLDDPLLFDGTVPEVVT